MEKVYSGKDHSIWQLNPKKNGLLEQMKPMQCMKVFRRGSSNSSKEVDVHNLGCWDCDCGVYVFGKVQEVEKAFEKLYAWMKKRTDNKMIVGLANYEALDYLAMFTSKKQDIAVIIGGGYYEATDESLLKVLEGLKNVYIGEIGANYSDDNDLYHTLVEDLDYQKEKGESINPMALAILSEVFTYWEKKDIQTKEEREDEGLEHIDLLVEEYRNSTKN